MRSAPGAAHRRCARRAARCRAASPCRARTDSGRRASWARGRCRACGRTRSAPGMTASRCRAPPAPRAPAPDCPCTRHRAPGCRRGERRPSRSAPAAVAAGRRWRARSSRRYARCPARGRWRECHGPLHAGSGWPVVGSGPAWISSMVAPSAANASLAARHAWVNRAVN